MKKKSLWDRSWHTLWGWWLNLLGTRPTVDWSHHSLYTRSGEVSLDILPQGGEGGVEKPEGVYQRGCEPKWHRQISAVNIHTSTGALAQDMNIHCPSLAPWYIFPPQAVKKKSLWDRSWHTLWGWWLNLLGTRPTVDWSHHSLYTRSGEVSLDILPPDVRARGLHFLPPLLVCQTSEQGGL